MRVHHEFHNFFVLILNTVASNYLLVDGDMVSDRDKKKRVADLDGDEEKLLDYLFFSN